MWFLTCLHPFTIYLILFPLLSLVFYQGKLNFFFHYYHFLHIHEPDPTSLKKFLLTSEHSGTGPCGGWMCLACLMLQYHHLSGSCLFWGFTLHTSSAKKMLKFTLLLAFQQDPKLWACWQCVATLPNLSLHSDLNKQPHLWYPKASKNQLILSISEPAGRSHHFVTHSLIHDWSWFLLSSQSYVLYFSIICEKHFFLDVTMQT